MNHKSNLCPNPKEKLQATDIYFNNYFYLLLTELVFFLFMNEVVNQVQYSGNILTTAQKTQNKKNITFPHA